MGMRDIIEKRMAENPTAIVQPGAELLDRAWAQINSLNSVYNVDGPRTVYFAGYAAALNQALSIIESLGGSDPLKRKHNRGES